MSLGPIEAAVHLKLGGVVSDHFYSTYERAIIEALAAAERWLQDLAMDIPKATGTLRGSMDIQPSYYGHVKTLKFGIYAAHAPYVLEFGRDPGKRPPWEKVRTWATMKGVDLRQARAWWWAHGREGRHYRSPRGQSLAGWWSMRLLQFKYFLERELKTRLQNAGFSMQDVQVTFT